MQLLPPASQAWIGLMLFDQIVTERSVAALAAWLGDFPSAAPAIIVLAEGDGPALRMPAALSAVATGAPVLVVCPPGAVALPFEGDPQALAIVPRPAGLALVALINRLVQLCGRRDMVLLAHDVVLPDGWLGRLQHAAAASSTVAACAPLCAGPGFRAAPAMPVLAAPAPLDAATLALASHALTAPRRPAILWAPSGCIYVRRLALDVLGAFDDDLPFADGAEQALWLRAAAAGLAGALADDLIVYRPHTQGAPAALPPATMASLRLRFHWLASWLVGLAAQGDHPLADALARGAAALAGLRIAIDATSVSDRTTGTQVLAVELIRALRAQLPASVTLCAIVSDTAGAELRALLGRHAHAVLSIGALREDAGPRFDLVHRPYQVYRPEQLDALLGCARRLVVSYLDFINYNSPLIFRTPEESLGYRQLTRRVYAVADGIAYISADAAHDAARHGLLLPDERACVTGMGVDHQLTADVAPAPPPLREALGAAPFLLMVGNGFAHKHRAFAVRLLQALGEQHGWSGQLVLAGADTLVPVPEPLQARVHQPGVVSEAQKRWLMTNAALVLMPSLSEGFGLIPFEAAALGTPAIASRQAALAEVLGDKLCCFDSFEPAAAASAAWALLSDPEAAARQVALIRERAAHHSWERAAAATWAFYQRVLALPPRPRDGEAHATEALRLQGALAAELLDYRTLMRSRTLGPLTRAIIAAHVGARKFKDRIAARWPAPR